MFWVEKLWKRRCIQGMYVYLESCNSTEPNFVLLPLWPILFFEARSFLFVYYSAVACRVRYLQTILCGRNSFNFNSNHLILLEHVGQMRSCFELLKFWKWLELLHATAYKPTMDKTCFYRKAIRDESTNFPFVYIFMMANH